jgi:hypothetical protein
LGGFIFCDKEMMEAQCRKNSLKRVLIIHAEGNTFNIPSLKCIIDLLLAKGCEIDLCYSKSAAPMPEYEGIRFMPYGAWIRRWKTLVIDRFCIRPLVFLTVLAQKLAYYKKYDLIIGVDRKGLIEASILSKITKTPYVFISFEIMFEEETSVRYKSLEREASRNVATWLIQDEERAGQLQRENLLNPATKILLPLASAGAGMAGVSRLRDTLGIPGEKKVAIVIGSITNWAMSTQIMKSVTAWPDDWVLVVHARYGNTRELLAEELSAFAGLLGSRIFLSDASTDMVDDMGGILAGVSAGLAFYKPEFKRRSYRHFIGKNLEYLGLSSGKISTYLRYGVPVIINEVGLYAERTRQFRFGCVVERPEQIKDCLDEISHAEYRKNAKNYFATKLDFNVYRDQIWSRMEAIVDGEIC